MANKEPAGEPARRRSSPLDDRLLVRPAEAFAMLGVGKTMGFELMRAGHLQRVRIGKRAVGISVLSIRRLVEDGLPLPSPIERPRGSRS